MSRFDTIPLQIAVGVMCPQFAPVLAAAMTAAGGGNFVDILKAAALMRLNIKAWGRVGDLTEGMSAGGWFTTFEGFMGNATSTVIHGIAGGALSCLEGGSFKDGFLGAAVGEACAGAINNLHHFANDQMNILERSAAAGIVGGTAAVASGGNFITGASTAAFARLYNEEAHRIKENFNIDKAVKALDNNAESASQGECARYVRKALEAGGLDTHDHPKYAKNYGPFLTDMGFETVSQDDYSALKGDIAVIDSPNRLKPYGHIQMYDGGRWVSDFKQNGFWPGQSYRQNEPDYEIYRWEKK